MRVSLYCWKKTDDDGTGTEVLTVEFSASPPGDNSGSLFSIVTDRTTYDSLSVGTKYDFTFSGPSA